MGKERSCRVSTEEGLALRRKRLWRHATVVHREQRRPATTRNEIWSMDFVADQIGRRPAVSGADHHRPVHAGVPVHRSRPNPRRSRCCSRTGTPADRARPAATDLLRQRATSEVKETGLLRADVPSATSTHADRQAVSTRAESHAHHSYTRSGHARPAFTRLNKASYSRWKVRALSTRSHAPRRILAKGSSRLVSPLQGSDDSQCRW